MNDRFSLESAVSAWKRALVNNERLSTNDTDELESHLRDEIDDLVAGGCPEHEAFEQAVRRIGDLEFIDAAYRRVYWEKRIYEHGLVHEITWRGTMVGNYIKTALRNCRRQKVYTAINVLGLAIGLASCFFILLWVQDESSFDRFHKDGDRLYRLMRHARIGDQVYTWAAMPKPLEKALEDQFPEITHVATLNWDQQFVLTYNNQSYREVGTWAGSDFFAMFTYPFLQGDPAGALATRESIAISEKVAGTLFGKNWDQASVLGKVITVNNDKDYTVSGVFKNVPENSSQRFDVMLPIEEYFQANQVEDYWGNNSFLMYVKLAEGADGSAVSRKIAGVINAHNEGADNTLFLQPYLDMRLYSDYRDGKLVGGRIEIVRIFSIVAVFLLLIASVNYMNLATARSMKRSREIGIRKAVGASQRSLVGQFMGESLVISFFAFLLALGFILALLPLFNELVGKHISFGSLNVQFLVTILGIALATGLVSGFYPALHLSSYSPVSVLRDKVNKKVTPARLRKGLVVFQFALSSLLIITTIAVYRQIEYIQTKELGFDRENVIRINLEGGIRDRYETFRQELLNRTGIASVSISNQDPFDVGSSTTDPEWDGKSPESEQLFYIINSDYDYVETMKMDLVAGRNFSRQFSTDTAGFIVNEKAVQAMGMKDPIGQRLSFWDREGRIIGVVKDFHMASLYAPIEPTIIRLDPENTWRLFVRTEAGKTKEALAGLEKVYKQFNPSYPFEYRFMDEVYDRQYRAEAVLGKLANIFALIAVVISCLGLFGLASFTAEQRTREIGIRKALGASVSNLILLLSVDFTRLVVIASVIVIPLGYWVVDAYLSHFTYRIEISVLMFVAAVFVALVVAALTVSYHAIKTARLNPVKVLRYE